MHSALYRDGALMQPGCVTCQCCTQASCRPYGGWYTPKVSAWCMNQVESPGLHSCIMTAKDIALQNTMRPLTLWGRQVAKRCHLSCQCCIGTTCWPFGRESHSVSRACPQCYHCGYMRAMAPACAVGRAHFYVSSCYFRGLLLIPH